MPAAGTINKLLSRGCPLALMARQKSLLGETRFFFSENPLRRFSRRFYLVENSLAQFSFGRK